MFKFFIDPCQGLHVICVHFCIVPVTKLWCPSVCAMSLVNITIYNEIVIGGIRCSFFVCLELHYYILCFAVFFKIGVLSFDCFFLGYFVLVLTVSLSSSSNQEQKLHNTIKKYKCWIICIFYGVLKFLFLIATTHCCSSV